MTPRDLAAAIRKAPRVYVFVKYSDEDGMYIDVPKTSARLVLDQAGPDYEDLNAHVGAEGAVFIG